MVVVWEEEREEGNVGVLFLLKLRDWDSEMPN